MKRAIAIALWWIPALLLIDSRTESVTRIADDTHILENFIAAPDNAPRNLFDRAQCIGTFSWSPERRFKFGPTSGKGMIVCRTRRSWSAPSLITVSGGNITVRQVNRETAVLLVAESRTGERSLMQGRLTVRARGEPADIVFLPISPDTSTGIDPAAITITPDIGGNRALYGYSVTSQDILAGNVPAPAIAADLYDDLAGYTPDRIRPFIYR